MPTKKKKFNARFPPARIKKIMQTDDDVGKVAAPVPVIISKALEMFLQTMVEKSCSYTHARNAKTLTTAHIKKCINSEQQFDFLKDLVEKIPDLPEEEEDVDGEPKPKRRKAPSANKEKEPRRKRKSKKDQQVALSDDSEDYQEEEPESEEETSMSGGCHSNMALNSSTVPSVSTSNNPSLVSRHQTDAPSITITKPEATSTISGLEVPSYQTINHVPMINSSKSVDDEDDDYDS